MKEGTKKTFFFLDPPIQEVFFSVKNYIYVIVLELRRFEAYDNGCRQNVSFLLAVLY